MIIFAQTRMIAVMTLENMMKVFISIISSIQISRANLTITVLLIRLFSSEQWLWYRWYERLQYRYGKSCDDRGECIATSSFGATTNKAFLDIENTYVDQSYETYDGDCCYEDTYQPLYSNSYRNNAQETDTDNCLIKVILACVFLWFLC